MFYYHLKFNIEQEVWNLLNIVKILHIRILSHAQKKIYLLKYLEQ